MIVGNLLPFALVDHALTGLGEERKAVDRLRDGVMQVTRQPGAFLGRSRPISNKWYRQPDTAILRRRAGHCTHRPFVPVRQLQGHAFEAGRVMQQVNNPLRDSNGIGETHELRAAPRKL